MAKLRCQMVTHILAVFFSRVIFILVYVDLVWLPSKPKTNYLKAL